MRFSNVDHNKTAVVAEIHSGNTGQSEKKPAGKTPYFNPKKKKNKKNGSKSLVVVQTQKTEMVKELEEKDSNKKFLTSGGFYKYPQNYMRKESVSKIGSGNGDERKGEIQSFVNDRIQKVRTGERARYMLFAGRYEKGARKKAADQMNILVNSLIEKIEVGKNVSEKTEMEELKVILDFKPEKKTAKPVSKSESKKASVLSEEEKKEKEMAFRNSCDAFVLQNLKKELKKSQVIAAVQEIFFALAKPENYTEQITNVPRADLQLFVKALNRDYIQVKNQTDVSKSIYAKNVKIQYNPETDLLEWTFKNNTSDKSCKKELFPFLVDLAVSEEDAIKNLYDLKRILLTFFYGKEGDWTCCYQSEKDLWSFAWLEMLEEENGLFSQKADEIMLREEYLAAPLTDREEQLAARFSENEKAPVFGLKEKKTVSEDERKAGRKRDLSIKLHAEAKEAIRYEIYGRFLKCIKDEEALDSEKYWYYFIKESLEQYFENANNLQHDRNKTLLLCEKTWGHMTQFLAEKYRDMGKAVFHFAIPEVTVDYAQNDPLVYGKVLAPYKKGITSFHYEQIHAEESLKKELSVQLAFAVNILNQSAGNGKKADYLSLLVNELKEGTRPDAADRLLRFWGGKSKWGQLTKEEKEQLPAELQSVMIFLRNQNYHYNFVGKERLEDYSVLKSMYKAELEKTSELFCEKMYSNNVPFFYQETQLREFMTWLYRPAREPKNINIPSYRSVIKRNDLFAWCEEEGILLKNQLPEAEYMTVFSGALDYILKEIYQRRFAGSPALTELFKNAVKKELSETIKAVARYSMNENIKKMAYEIGSVSYEQILSEAIKLKDAYEKGGFDRKQEDTSPDELEHSRKAKKDFLATLDFANRVDELLGPQFHYNYADLCHELLMEVNQQSQKTGRSVGKQHYKKLLHICTCRAFWQYVKNEKNCVFLNKVNRHKGEFGLKPGEELKKTEFLKDWTCSYYETFAEEKECIRWYAIGRLLHPNQLNHLIGVIKDYQSYVSWIQKRAEALGQNWDASFSEKSRNWDHILRTLELCIQYSGRVSGEISDYYLPAEEYATEEEQIRAVHEAYAGYLKEFLDFTDPEMEKHEISLYDQLVLFCKEENGSGENIGIFTDEKNPIVQRNIELMRMYGGGNAISHALRDYKVTKEDIRLYYTLKGEVDGIHASGKIRTEMEQRRIIDYQQLKRRVELHNITDYSELIYDMLGRMINLTYVRERDQMYFRLGYYYTKLNYGLPGCKTLTEEERTAQDKKLRVYPLLPEQVEEMKNKTYSDLEVKDGFVFHQIIGMETFGVPVYKVSSNLLEHKEYLDLSNNQRKKQGFGIITSGRPAKQAAFMRYFGEYNENGQYQGMLRLLYSAKEEKETRDLCNWIDHFLYFAKVQEQDNDNVQENREVQYSLMQAWSVLYDIFFCYDRKMKMLVPELLKSRLEKYFIITDLFYQKNADGTTSLELHAPDEKYPNKKLVSELFTYKYENGEVQIPARDRIYLDALEKILFFKNV